MGTAEGHPSPQAGAASPSSLGSCLPPTPLGVWCVLVVCGEAQVLVLPLVFSLLMRCSSSSSRVDCRVRLGGTEGQRSLRVTSRVSPWPTSRGGEWQAGLHPSPALERGSTCLGVLQPHCNGSPPAWAPPHPHWNGDPPTWVPPHPHWNGGPPRLGNPELPLEWGSTLPGRPGTWQDGHCSARRQQVNLAEPGFDLKL